MESVIQKVLDSDWTNLQKDLEKDVARKIIGRISEKKIDFLAKLNGITSSQMRDAMVGEKE